MSPILPTPEMDNAPLSRWWIRAILLVMVIGFGVLIAITTMGYTNAPPIPGKVVGPQGRTLFTRADINGGQGVFLKYGLMDNGSVWGHGAYLGPIFPPQRCTRWDSIRPTRLPASSTARSTHRWMPGNRRRSAARLPSR